MELMEKKLITEIDEKQEKNFKNLQVEIFKVIKKNTIEGLYQGYGENNYNDLMEKIIEDEASHLRSLITQLIESGLGSDDIIDIAVEQLNEKIKKGKYGK